MTALNIQRDPWGRLSVLTGDGQRFDHVTPLRAFPITAPGEGLSLMSADGHEIVWIERLADLPPSARELIEAELASREFVPEIARIRSVSSFACPSAWQVETDRGACELVLKGEENIRRLSPTRLLIADGHGIQFLIRDLTALDRQSRKLLDRFL
ncbi:MAG: DUF1854 domain-containing protein [Azonexus sp.]|jgi:hypothetical protein|nr:DUF1854 domain-containing protein [Azonexus sp.]